ncbi:MAG: DUF6731 family protein [Chloroflexota bacterium]
MPERKVAFYECQNVDGSPAFDRLAAAEAINGLDDSDWKVPDYDGASQFGVIVDQVGTKSKPSQLRFLRIREDAPYVLSAARKLTPVQVEEDERISEFTHVVIWPDGFMGAISTREAPSHKRLSLYFDLATNEYTHIVNLFDPDAFKRLHELVDNDELRNIKIKLQSSQLDHIEEAKKVRGFGNILKAGRGTEAVTIGIEVGVGRSRTVSLDPELAAGAVELAEMGDQLEQMIVKGRDKHGDIQTINMKWERIAEEISVADGVDNATIYALIREARKQVEKRIGKLDRAARGS